MRGFFIFVLCLLIGLLAVLSGFKIYYSYDYENRIQGYWELADKSSTISQKAEYINKFVEVIGKEKLEGSYGALIFKKIGNSFDNNFKALKSLQGRLNIIKNLDENSFAYQSAIQQITAQEQGEANNMLSVIENCWYINNHFMFYGDIFFIVFLLLVGCIFISGLFISES